MEEAILRMAKQIHPKATIFSHRVDCGFGRTFDPVRVWWVLILVTVLLVLLFLADCSGPDILCHTGQAVSCCKTKPDITITNSSCPMFYVCCEDGKNPDQCCQERDLGSHVANLKQLPIPDLSYTTLDGFVDSGTSKLKVEIPAEGDSLETNMTGRVAITLYPLQILLVELRSVQEKLTTVNQKPVLGLFARNANTWTGTRLNDGRLNMDNTNKLALEATIGDTKQGVVLNPNAYFNGAIYNNVWRMTDTGSSLNNKIEIIGSFGDNKLKVSLTISIWATNCQPTAHPSATCEPAIESGFPGHLDLTSKPFERMENMQSSQDLCDTLLVSDPVSVCTPGMRDEFPTFTCKKQTLPLATTPAEIAKQLKFSWTDATGYVFSDQYEKTLNWTPVFPITLTVENKWGRKISSQVIEPLQSYNCPKEMEYVTNRVGSDYKNFDLAQADPYLCQASCDQEAQCKAWTYVKSGNQAPKARCWLKKDVPAVSSDSCCISGVKGMEYLIDRGGSDYKNFDLVQADPMLCRTSCNEEEQCKAWTYVKPGIQNPKARCWLKNEVPAVKHDSCCVSGVKGIEYVTNRVGSDYKNFDLVQADPELCRTSCSNEAQCKAWTYVKPGNQGSKARCWLKKDVPAANPDTCCISGVKRRTKYRVNSP